MGLGGYPATDELSIGMLGMHGTYEANMAMHNSDLILAAGARFDDRATNDASKFCPNAKVIHIDVDPATISKNVTAEDRKSTRLNSSHVAISYAVFCLTKKKKQLTGK